MAGSQPSKNADGVSFDGTDDILFDANRRPAYIGTHILGDDITCTGLARAPDKTWWIIGHPVGQAYARMRLYHYSADLSTRLGYVETTLGGVQGAAYDTDDDTLWLGHFAKGVMHIALDGTVLPDGISPSDPGMTWDTAGGIAIDQASGHLIICEDTSGNAIQIIDKRDKSVIKSGTYSETDKDHLFFDQDSRLLIATAGGNGSPGNAIFFGIDGTNFMEKIARISLPQVLAIEGIVYDEGKLFVCDDQHYHATASGENAIQEYACGQIAGRVLDIYGVISFASTTPTDALFVLGDPLSSHGAGLYVAGENALQLRAKSSSAPGAPATNFHGLPNMANPRIVYARIDTISDAFTLWVDGSLITDRTDYGTLSKFYGPICDRVGLTIGAAHEGSDTRFLPLTTRSLGYALRNTGFTDDREKIEGWLAHEFGLIANLPSGHPYKATAP
ncbi:hypothetical protein [Aurantiacibacter suaedae]|uniref:hypothetical protein n=1 Tax=Aurantiacibacter suaedae TaxID=2545755 RepID=UPI0010F81B75|nr:hypothetical protein [Aurantiacibacter suaedae]